MHMRVGVALIVLLHVGLAALFAWVTPYRTPGIYGDVFLEDIGAPDEAAHSLYVQMIAEGKGIPVIIEGRPLPTYEAHQPPLYYAASAAWSRALGIVDFDSHRSGFLIRLLNVLFGGVAVAGVCAFAWWGYRRKDVTLVAGGSAALLPMNVAVSGAISNDPLLFLAGAWMLAFCAKAVRDGWNLKTALAIGAFAGIGLLTKNSAVVFVFAFVPAVLAAKDRPKVTVWGWAVALTLLIPLPLWIRNYSLYGDPLMFTVLNQISESQRANGILAADGVRGLARVATISLQLSSMSFIGLFGYMNIRLPLEVYLGGVLLAGWMSWGWVRGLKSPEQTQCRRVNGVAGWFVVGALLAYFAYNLTYLQPQARYVFYALGPMVVALAFGLRYWTRRYFAVSAAVLLLGLLAVDLASVGILQREFATMQEAYRSEGAAELASDRATGNWGAG